MIIKSYKGFIEYKMIGKDKHRLYELMRIEVLPKFRQKGNGERLFNILIKILEKKKFRKLFCTTHPSNKIAHKFYEKMGMSPEAILPDHYYKGEPEIVYAMYS